VQRSGNPLRGTGLSREQFLALSTPRKEKKKEKKEGNSGTKPFLPTARLDRVKVDQPDAATNLQILEREGRSSLAAAR